MELRLYNTLSREKEAFRPLHDDAVGLYACGPTVYHYAHIGNLRTYVFEDLLRRTLEYNGFEVKHVMNVTDVGHLTGDRDMGEDKLEVGAAREGKTAWEIADFYLKAFQKDIAALNILDPVVWCKATDYIEEQVRLIAALEAKGFTYVTSDGVYFDTAKFPEYNKLSHLKLDELKEGARIEKNVEKKNPTDFALWKFTPAGVERQMEWESPWGKGFPGWHIECSAMSLHFLKGSLDIHSGGVDHINIHHTNEIAQSEAATGEKFFNYWLHGAPLNVGSDEKMSKSQGNILTLEAVSAENGTNPLSFRYLCLMTHYRKPMAYKPEALKQADAALKNLRRQLENLKAGEAETDTGFKQQFLEAINDDLNLPQAVAVTQAVLKSSLKDEVKAATILDFDKVLGLGLSVAAAPDLPTNVRELAVRRQEARNERDWNASDELREQIEKLGYSVEDGADGTKIRKT